MPYIVGLIQIRGLLVGSPDVVFSTSHTVLVHLSHTPTERQTVEENCLLIQSFRCTMSVHENCLLIQTLRGIMSVQERIYCLEWTQTAGTNHIKEGKLIALYMDK